MEDKLQTLYSRINEVYDLQRAAAVLEWDQQTYMPPGSVATRSEQIATLTRIAHDRFTSDELGELLDDLSTANGYWPYESNEASMVRVTAREFTRQRKLPSELVAEISRAASLGHAAWGKAHAKSDFAMFKPHLVHLLELRRQQAEHLGPYDHIYDALLENFEPGNKTADVQAMFAGFKDELVELVHSITAHADRVSDDVLHHKYEIEKQRNFGLKIATQLGYDLSRGRQDEAAHPFCTSFSTGDVRITTRFYENFISSALFSTIHEVGHGLYEQGIDPFHNRTGLQDGASLGIHESQSRLWENLVGRSRAFWQYFYSELQHIYPESLEDIDNESFYRAINKVEPALIRVEADEVTYNLHILIRFELEMALLTGELSVDDLPQAWNDKYETYLGVRPTNDAEGVLQDVHWSEGYIGYFPTYSIGNVVSVQLWEQIEKAIPDLQDQIAQGRFGDLLEWLRTNVHQHGKKFMPAELIQRLTGGPLDSRPYMRYLQEKYSEIYAL